MARVLKRPLARVDLAEIWSYIADDSDAAADRFLDALEVKFALLATQPRMGRQRDVMPDLRSFPAGRYVVCCLGQRRRHRACAGVAWSAGHWAR